MIIIIIIIIIKPEFIRCSTPYINQWRIVPLSRSTNVVNTEVFQQWLHLREAEERPKARYTYNTVHTNDIQWPGYNTTSSWVIYYIQSGPPVAHNVSTVECGYLGLMFV